jgi:tetratricopeptide (TPR) repeat protein
MLVVEPTTARFEGEGVARGGVEEHLLERISALENHLSRLTDKVLQLAELSLRQSSTNYLDQTLLQALISVLVEAQAIDRRRLDTAWRSIRDGERAEKEARARREGLCETVVAAGGGVAPEGFARSVREGFRLLSDGKTKQAVRELEQAVGLSSDNAPLNAFLGEHYFGAGKAARAREHLSRALAADPSDARLTLLLGLACAEVGDAEHARPFLQAAVERAGPSFAAHCALGRLSAAEADWKGALKHFKLALAARPCPLGHFLLGLANYRLERFRTALRHLSKAVEAEPKYAEAHFLKGFAHLGAGERGPARESFAAAAAADPEEPLYRAARRGLARTAPPRAAKLKEPPVFFDAGGKLPVGMEARLAAALREDALGGAATR